MDMDSFNQASIAPIMEAVDIADILVIGFSTFTERVLFDPRTSGTAGPWVQVVLPVGNVEERVRELRRLRPGLPDPERFVFFVWPRSVAALVELGVWERAMRRVRVPEHPEIEVIARDTLGQLLRLEQEELINAITGTKYKTLWERKP